VVVNGERLAVVLERIDGGGDAGGAKPPADPQVEIGPVKLPESTWRKALPIVGYLLIGAALAVTAAAATAGWIAVHRGP
jgi:hypothetical protein